MPIISRPRFRSRPPPRPRSRGQAIVEFALILPVFLMLTLGVVDMARVFTSYIALTNGVSSAALYAGSGGALKWCTATPDASDLPCPASSSGQTKPNPDNVAYQIRIEATGIDSANITMAAPRCTLSGGGTEDCKSSTPGAYTQVQITADYSMTMLTPMITNLMGGPVHMTATTTAVILQ